MQIEIINWRQVGQHRNGGRRIQLNVTLKMAVIRSKHVGGNIVNKIYSRILKVYFVGYLYILGGLIHERKMQHILFGFHFIIMKADS